jgi:hypothetical protein
MAKGNYQIPFDQEGNQQEYYSAYWSGSDIELKDNFIFEDCLTYDSYGRGRSSVSFVFSRPAGQTVTMFISDFTDIIPKLKEGTIAGKFTFCKKGSNFGCKYLGPLDVDDGQV